MLNKKQFQKIILDNVTVYSEIERSRILFSVGTIVVIIFASLFFLAYDIYLGYTSSLLVYTPFILIFASALHLLRIGKIDLGCILLLVALNFFVYIVMSSIPEDSMSALFYLSIIVVEYVLLGNDRSVRLFALLGLSFTLYLIDAFFEFSLLPIRQYDETTLQVNKVFDFAICVIGLLMTIKLLIDYLQYIISERTRNNEELQRLNNELDKYAYTITHDLKGPIHSMVYLLSMPDLERSDIDHHLTTVREGLQNLSGLIDGVTAQASNRNMAIEKEEFNLSETMEIIWELIRHTPDAKDIELILDVPKELIVKTDKRRIIGILNNLITNSIRYHDKSKDKQYIKVFGQVKSNWLFLSVEDNGSGIEPEFQQKVFDMFYRASNLMGGSGIGLFTVKESVDKLSGQIDLDSTFGKGTIFNIKIPVDSKK